MPGKLGNHRASGKESLCRKRQSKETIRQQFSPVMQKVLDLLPSSKTAQHLHILTDLPVSTCQKLVCGQRPENLELVTALLRSSHGREVLIALMGDARPDWFIRFCKQLDVNAARRALAESQRLIEKLQREAAE